MIVLWTPDVTVWCSIKWLERWHNLCECRFSGCVFCYVSERAITFLVSVTGFMKNCNECVWIKVYNVECFIH